MDAAFALILTCLLAGYACGRFNAMPRDGADVLNRFVIYVSLPATVLKLVPRLSWQPGLALLVVMPWLLTFIAVGMIVGAARVARFPRAVCGALLLCVPLGNTSFLGFPMIAALLGPGAVRYALLYDQFGSFLILSTYGLVVAARFSGGANPSARALLLRLLRFPPFLALVIAFVPVAHPTAVSSVLESLSQTLIPIAMFAVGLKLELRPPKARLAFGLGLALKMAVLPLVALGIGTAFHTSPLVLRVAVLESAMPPMITAGAVAILSGLAPELAAALVGYGVLAALVTIPIWSKLLG